MNSRSLLWLPLLGLCATVAQAGDCCHRGNCGMVCKLVCTTRTVEKTCYGYECEQVCIPGPSKKGEKHCQPAGKCHLLCRLRWTDWCAGCATPICRKNLTKYIAKREVRSHKWVVVPACCCKKGAAGDSVKQAPTNAKVGDQYALTMEELRRLSTRAQRRDVPPERPPVIRSVRQVPEAIGAERFTRR